MITNLRSLKGFLWLFLLLITGLQTVSAQSGWNLIRRTASFDLNTVFFVSSERGWIGGDSGYVALTEDSGNNWSKIPLETTANINEIYFRNKENGFILAGSKFFLTDDGFSWREIKVIKENEFRGADPELYSIRFSDKKRGWIVGSVSKSERVVDSLVFQTEDGGNSWRRVKVPSTEELIHLDFVNETNGWIVGVNGTILATDDGGKTWLKQTSGTDATLFNVDFRNSKEGCVVGGKSVILRTEDGGKTWQKIPTNFTGTFWRISFIDDKTGWITGRSGIVLRTDDKGKTWVKQDSKTTDNLFGLYIDKKGGWAVGGKGVVIRYQR